jgi:hypothetical protein
MIVWSEEISQRQHKYIVPRDFTYYPVTVNAVSARLQSKARLHKQGGQKQKTCATRTLSTGETEPIRPADNTAREEEKNDQHNETAAAATARAAASKSETRFEEIKELVEQK